MPFPVFDPATPKVSTLSIGKGVLPSAIELVAEATQQAAKFRPQASDKAGYMLKAYGTSSTKCILTNGTGVRLQFFEADSKGILPEYKPPPFLEPGEDASFLVDTSVKFELKYNIQTFQGPMAGWVSGDANKTVGVKGVAGDRSVIDAVVQVDRTTMYQTQFTFSVSFNDNLWQINVNQSITGIKGFYYVTRHIDYGHVQGDIYASVAEASAKFDELNGGSKAAAVWESKTAAATSPATDEQLTELKYYGSRGTRPEEMKEWARARLNTRTKYYVTRHIARWDVQGDIYASEVEAFAKFDELNGGSEAAAVWDEQLTELKYYGSRADQYGSRPEEMKKWARERPDPAGY